VEKLTVVSELSPTLIEEYLPGHPQVNEKLVVGVQKSVNEEPQLVELSLINGGLTVDGISYSYAAWMNGYEQDETPLLSSLKLEFIAVNVGYKATLEVTY
jgi:acyl-CoA synthetase (AMP-forming)/AMP-acid ligase II